MGWPTRYTVHTGERYVANKYIYYETRSDHNDPFKAMLDSKVVNTCCTELDL